MGNNLSAFAEQKPRSRRGLPEGNAMLKGLLMAGSAMKEAGLQRPPKSKSTKEKKGELTLQQALKLAQELPGGARGSQRLREELDGSSSGEDESSSSEEDNEEGAADVE